MDLYIFCLFKGCIIFYSKIPGTTFSITLSLFASSVFSPQAIRDWNFLIDSLSLLSWVKVLKFKIPENFHPCAFECADE